MTSSLRNIILDNNRDIFYIEFPKSRIKLKYILDEVGDTIY